MRLLRSSDENTKLCAFTDIHPEDNIFYTKRVMVLKFAATLSI